jgi:hypothetical protein
VTFCRKCSLTSTSATFNNVTPDLEWTRLVALTAPIHELIARGSDGRHGPRPGRNDAAQSLLLGLRRTKLKCCRDWQESVPTQVS